MMESYRIIEKRDMVCVGKKKKKDLNVKITGI